MSKWKENIFLFYLFRIVLKIKATDNGLPSLSSECEVEMKILDENDNDPKISLTPVYPDAKYPQGILSYIYFQYKTHTKP